MISMFAKMWVSIFSIFIALGVLIIGGQWFKDTFGTGPTLAVFAVLFVVLFSLSTFILRRR